MAGQSKYLWISSKFRLQMLTNPWGLAFIPLNPTCSFESDSADELGGYRIERPEQLATGGSEGIERLNPDE